MAEEEKIEKTEEIEPGKEEKLDIDDIKDPDEKAEDLDLEEAVSEDDEEPKEEKAEKTEEKEDQKEEPKEEIIADTKEIKKPKKAFPLKSVLLIVLTVLLTAAIVLGGVYYYLNNLNKKDESKTGDTQTEEAAEEPATDTPATTDKFVYVSEPSGLNLREEANTAGKLVVIMPYGSKLKVLTEQNDWLQVEFEGKTGWCAKQYTSEKNPLVYQNTEYGFELTFPQGWAQYKVFKKSISGTTTTYYVGLPTTDSTYVDSGTDKGYASLFAVSVYTTSQWATISAEDGPKPTKLGEKGSYVFAWSHSQAAPSDLESKFNDPAGIIATFKLI